MKTYNYQTLLSVPLFLIGSISLGMAEVPKGSLDDNIDQQVALAIKTFEGSANGSSVTSTPFRLRKIAFQDKGPDSPLILAKQSNNTVPQEAKPTAKDDEDLSKKFLKSISLTVKAGLVFVFSAAARLKR